MLSKCIQLCIDPDIPTYTSYSLDQLLQKNQEYLGEHLSTVITNMEGKNPDKMTEWYQNFDILLKDIAYSTHYTGIYPAKNL